MQHNNDRLNVAMARYQRRCQLWKAARAACPSYASFRASTGAIEGAVSRLLADEFGP
ncbi:hypothetical protein PhaeoP70_00670 [Phaeobacter inhibens]|nr:hypothetical protein PhaeoP92_00671 [Phaeobacter inhibens]AUQ77392.1 hypothetical protein PhaeoP74_00672 [Phaeobacter inhibens]AUR14551.1 hypothetical protein PhaeoP70_00670 [Phaeobacter inhibens]